MFSGHKIVDYCIISIYVVSIPFRHWALNIFGIFSCHQSFIMWSRCCCRGAKKIVAYPAFPQSKQEENPSSEPLSIPSKHPSTSHTLKKWLDRILAIKHHFPQRMGFFRGNRGFHLSCTTHGCTQCTHSALEERKMHYWDTKTFLLLLGKIVFLGSIVWAFNQSYLKSIWCLLELYKQM